MASKAPADPRLELGYPLTQQHVGAQVAVLYEGNIWDGDKPSWTCCEIIAVRAETLEVRLRHDDFEARDRNGNSLGSHETWIRLQPGSVAQGSTAWTGYDLQDHYRWDLRAPQGLVVQRGPTAWADLQPRLNGATILAFKKLEWTSGSSWSQLAEGMKTLRTLVALDFSHCDSLKDDAVTALSEAIRIATPPLASLHLGSVFVLRILA